MRRRTKELELFIIKNGIWNVNEGICYYMSFFEQKSLGLGPQERGKLNSINLYMYKISSSCSFIDGIKSFNEMVIKYWIFKLRGSRVMAGTVSWLADKYYSLVHIRREHLNKDIMEICENGLLTDEDLAAMKKILIEQ